MLGLRPKGVDSSGRIVVDVVVVVLVWPYHDGTLRSPKTNGRLVDVVVVVVELLVEVVLLVDVVVGVGAGRRKLGGWYFLSTVGGLTKALLVGVVVGGVALVGLLL